MYLECVREVQKSFDIWIMPKTKDGCQCTNARCVAKAVENKVLRKKLKVARRLKRTAIFNNIRKDQVIEHLEKTNINLTRPIHSLVFVAKLKQRKIKWRKTRIRRVLARKPQKEPKKGIQTSTEISENIPSCNSTDDNNTVIIVIDDSDDDELE